MTKEIAITAVESKYRGDFLRDVLAGRAGAPADVVAARPVARLGPRPPGRGPGRRARHRARARACRWATRPGGGGAVHRRLAAALVGRADATVAGRGLRHRGGGAAAGARRVRPGVGWWTPRSRTSPATAGAGDGRSRPGSAGWSTSPDELPAAYEQARKALHVGRQLHGPGALAHFDELGVFRLLALIDDTGELQRLRHRDARATWQRHVDRGGRPAADAPGAARHQPQRRRDRAPAALPLQHAALPDRASSSGWSGRSRPTRTCGWTSRWRCGWWRCGTSEALGRLSQWPPR